MINLFLSVWLLLGNVQHNHSPPELGKGFELSPKQEKCLVRNLWHEARGSTFEDQLWIAQTTINRKGSKGFPDSICGVVHQKNAFSWYHQIPKNKHRVQPDNILEKKAYDQIKFVIDVVEVLNSFNIDVTQGSLFYYKTGTKKPNYIKSKKIKYIKTVGEHKYYKLKEEI